MATVKLALDRLEQWGEQTVRGTLLSLSSAIIKDTPVDTGRLRSNWMPSVGSPDTSQVPATSEAQTISALSGVVGNLTMGQTFYLTNNLPYAAAIEYGHSKRFPEGMLRKNVAKYDRAIREAAR